MNHLRVVAPDAGQFTDATGPGSEHEREAQARARTGPRLDTVLTTLIERQVAAVLSGIAVAATHAEPGSPDTDHPTWLAEDLQIAVRLTRLALAAGMVLPAALPSSPTDGPLPSRHAHLVRSRSRYQAISEVFGRLMQEGTLPPECMPDAGLLLTEVGTQLTRIDGTPRDDVTPEVRPEEPHALAHRDRGPGEFLPGELLG